MAKKEQKKVEKKVEEKLHTVRVTYPFTDAKNGRGYGVGDTFEATEARIAEINKVAGELNLSLIEVL